MKKILTSLLLFFMVLTVRSSTVDVTTAQTVAENFYKQVAGNEVTLMLVTDGATAGNWRDGKSLPNYYVFNAPGQAGFVVVSAEDATHPILGYETHGSFSMKGAPTALKNWMNKYSQQITYARANALTANAEINKQWTSYLHSVSGGFKQLRSAAVGPLCTTTWDQDQYYNDYCPSDASSPAGYNGHVPTGCGATAMSQIMRYWSYPARGTGQNSYTSNYGVLSANFGTTTYNWANMPNSVTSTNTDVATIMADCGVAVDMIYGPNESSSYLLPGTGIAASCQQAYTTYFGYNTATIQGGLKANYSQTDWLNMIQTELNAGRPIQYAGSGPYGGHTFVLDGSDASGNFHINWGWSGTDNGFYNIDALDPSPYANGTFDQDEQMVIGIEPAGSIVSSTGIDLYAAITVTPNPIAFDQTFTVTTNLINDGSNAFNGSYACALFDSAGNFIRLIGNILNTGSSPLQPTYYYTSGLTFSDTTSFITVPGTYTIGIFYEAIGASTWTLAGSGSYTNPISVQVQGPSDQIVLTNDMVLTPSTFVQGHAASLNVNLGNNGSTTYYGTYEAVLLTLQGNFVELLGTYTESGGLQAGYQYNAPYLTFSTGNLTAPEGQYLLAIGEQPQGTSGYYYCGGQTYRNPILINVVNEGILINNGVQDISEDQIKMYPNPATNKVNIISTGVPMAVTVSDLSGQMVLSALLNSASSTLDVSNLTAGIYMVRMQQQGKTFNRKLVIE